jgi:hypothetical protein
VVNRKLIGVFALVGAAAGGVLLPLAGFPLGREIGTSTSASSSSFGNTHTTVHTVSIEYALNWSVCAPLAGLILLGIVLLLLPRRHAGK